MIFGQCRMERLRGPYLSAPFALCVLSSMDGKPRKSSFRRTFQIAIPIFLEEVMTDLVTEGRSWNVYRGQDRSPCNLPKERPRLRPRVENFRLPWSYAGKCLGSGPGSGITYFLADFNFELVQNYSKTSQIKS